MATCKKLSFLKLERGGHVGFRDVGLICDMLETISNTCSPTSMRLGKLFYTPSNLEELERGWCLFEINYSYGDDKEEFLERLKFNLETFVNKFGDLWTYRILEIDEFFI